MRTIILFIAILLPAILRAQNINWDMASAYDDDGMASGYSIVPAPDGNYFVSGTFSDAIQIGSTTLTSAGGIDIYIAKYTSDGQAIWAVRCGGIGDDEVYTLCLDNTGSLYATGSLTSQSDFGTDLFTSNGETDIFITKMDTSGTFFWTKAWGSSSFDRGFGLCFSKAGYIYATGGYYDTVSFDDQILYAGPSGSVYTMKLNSSGNIIWAKTAWGTMTSLGISVCTDTLDNVYITGNGTNASMHFDAITTNNSSSFIAKYDSSGAIVWAKSIEALGSPVSFSAMSIVSDNQGGIYLCGGSYYNNSFKFDNITTSNTDNSFVAKYDASGNVQWVKQIGDSEHDILHQMILDADRNIYICGYYNTSGVFGSTTLSGMQSDNILVLKLNSAGNNIWAAGAGGNSPDGAMGIALTSNNNVLVTGYTNSYNATFGSIVLTTDWTSGRDMFVARLSQTTGISEATSNKQLLIYPTPANDAVYVGGVQKEGVYKVTNVTGAVVTEGSLYKGINRIEIAQLATGIYLLHSGNEVHKIVKE